MRIWLYNRLKNLAGLDAAFKADGHIISTGAADNPAKPFLLVSMKVESPPLGLPPSAGAQGIPFGIWVHDTPGSMTRIDDACVAIKTGLPTQDGFTTGGMSVYEVRWLSTGQDAYDDHFGTNCREVQFSMMTRR